MISNCNNYNQAVERERGGEKLGFNHADNCTNAHRHTTFTLNMMNFHCKAI